MCIDSSVLYDFQKNNNSLTYRMLIVLNVLGMLLQK